MNAKQYEGNWQQLKGRVREAWGVLTDSDIDQAQGQYDRLLGVIKERTGEAEEKIEQKLSALFDDK
ncbi:MAG: CsbD family protein [Candidatus Hydrogenedens sp.]|nr:CsbD family protein [Candidatus Hydrogenedens sp.]